MDVITERYLLAKARSARMREMRRLGRRYRRAGLERRRCVLCNSIAPVTDSPVTKSGKVCICPRCGHRWVPKNVHV